MEKTGIMICGHGSRSKAAVEEFRGLATEIAGVFRTIQLNSGFSSSPGRLSGTDSMYWSTEESRTF